MTRSITVPMGGLTSKLVMEIRITGLRRFRVRAAIAGRLMRLAAAVLGTRVDMSVDLRSVE